MDRVDRSARRVSGCKSVSNCRKKVLFLYPRVRLLLPISSARAAAATSLQLDAARLVIVGREQRALRAGLVVPPPGRRSRPELSQSGAPAAEGWRAAKGTAVARRLLAARVGAREAGSTERRAAVASHLEPGGQKAARSARSGRRQGAAAASPPGAQAAGALLSGAGGRPERAGGLRASGAVGGRVNVYAAPGGEQQGHLGQAAAAAGASIRRSRYRWPRRIAARARPRPRRASG